MTVNSAEDFRWESMALCQNTVGKRKPNGDADDPLFDSYESSEAQAQATDEMCRVCPVRKACFMSGAENKEQGVWGGFYLTNGIPDKSRNAHKTEDQWQELKDMLTSGT